MSRFPRLNLQTLMLLVAAVALAIEPARAWWDWHHEMLDRSAMQLSLAKIVSGWSSARTDEEDEPVCRCRYLATFPWLAEPARPIKCGNIIVWQP